MARTDDRSAGPPPLVSILRQGGTLIASIHTALDDTELLRFARDLVDRVGRDRVCGVIIDVAALDVLDSFASHTLSSIASTAKLRGATTVVVGINPEVAFAMVQLGIRSDTMLTALDLDEGQAVLDGLISGRGAGAGSLPSGRFAARK